MTTSKLKIILAASEIDPFSKTGGMADVTRSLPKAIKQMGHEVSIFTPLYSQIDPAKFNLSLIQKDLSLPIDQTTTLYFNIWQGEIANQLPVFFIEEKQYLSRDYQLEKNKIYTGKYDNARFLIFNLAVLASIKVLKLAPDIIQCHDWQTGLIPYYLHTTFEKDPELNKIATLYTIHNLTFQMGDNWWEIPLEQREDGTGELPPFNQPDKVRLINFAKRAIRFTDMINTVSERYAEEIMTKKFGNTLHHLLKQRKDRVFGIINGIDYAEWNPATDPGLIVQYDYNNLAGKTKNKLYLQKFLGLPQDPTIPIIGWTSRLTEQKGIELIIKIIEPLLRMNIQLVILGEGAKQYEEFFKKMSKRHPKKIAAILDFDNRKETMVLAGADIFLLPSRFEPCGLAQLKSLRYGAIPVVHAVGGLVDTISDYNPKTDTGNGFVFRSYDPYDLLVAISRALENHKHRDKWLKLVRRGMRQSYDWKIPARKYIKLFRKTIRYHLERNGQQ